MNFVHVDEIWKDHVNRESQSFIKKWPDKWGFLVKEYVDLNSSHLYGGVSPSHSRQRLSGISRQAVRLPPLATTSAASRNFPQTTSRCIGWKSTSKDFQLEKYGNNRCVKKGLLKQLNWPQQGLE